jgi:hypothetical protein
MIEAITSLDRPEVSAALARAARLLLATPTEGLRDNDQRLLQEGLPGRVVLELRERVAHRSNTIEQLFLNLTEELSREMSEWTLAGADLNEIKNRAGERGTLTAGLYEIVFTAHFHKSAPLYAVKRSYVIQAIRGASAVDHLRPLVIRSAISASLFLQTPRIQGRPYTLLVKCTRSGAILAVDEVFYLFHDAFDLGDAVTPRMALVRFLERFGLQISIAEHTGNPLQNVVITLPESGSVSSQIEKAASQLIFRGEPNTQFELVLACSVDQHKYSSYLTAHGIKSRPVGEINTVVRTSDFQAVL